MFGKFLKSKIHRATVTGADINYQGSITIDRELMAVADLQPFEFVDIWDVTNGSRIETYVIEGEAGSGCICINGAAAHLVTKGDLVIICQFPGIHEALDEGQDLLMPLVFIVHAGQLYDSRTLEGGFLMGLDGLIIAEIAPAEAESRSVCRNHPLVIEIDNIAV